MTPPSQSASLAESRLNLVLGQNEDDSLGVPTPAIGVLRGWPDWRASRHAVNGIEHEKRRGEGSPQTPTSVIGVHHRVPD